ncbi:MAG: tetratricopeptide repeat protein [Elusimicrobiota bacterium]
MRAIGWALGVLLAAGQAAASDLPSKQKAVSLDGPSYDGTSGAGLSREDGGGLEAEYRRAKEDIRAALDEIQRCEDRVSRASSVYERLNARRELERAQGSLSEAEAALSSARARMRPGDAVWEEETRVESGGERKSRDSYRFRVPSVGPGAEVDPRVHQRSWVGEGGSPGRPRPPAAPEVPARATPQEAGGGSGEIIYNRPAGYANPRSSGARSSAPPRDPPLRAPATAPFTLPSAPPVGGRGGPMPPESGLLPPPAREPEIPYPAYFVKEPGPSDFPMIFKAGRDRRGPALALIRSVNRGLRSGDLEAALRDADRLAAVEPADPGVHHLRAAVLSRMGRYAEAEAAARAAVSLDRERPAAYRTLAWAQLRQGKLREAAESVARALELDPHDTAAQAIRAHAREELGDAGPELRDIRRAAAVPSVRSSRRASSTPGARRPFRPPAPSGGPGFDDASKRADRGRSAVLAAALLGAAAGAAVVIAALLRRSSRKGRRGSAGPRTLPGG